MKAAFAIGRDEVVALQQQQRHFHSGGQDVNFVKKAKKWSIIASANSQESPKCVLNKTYRHLSHFSGKNQTLHIYPLNGTVSQAFYLT